ncbi:MAG TPA: hypothetical protein VHS58_14915 [Acetobacteraceae bacterium]|jgi:hypothetical protein|nr:hypothetical protein [Acetobacteraceae bacterium]
MSGTRTPEALAAEFDMFLARAGVTLTPEHRETALASYPDFRAQIDLLHAIRAHTAEPSNIYTLFPRRAES